MDNYEIVMTVGTAILAIGSIAGVVLSAYFNRRTSEQNREAIELTRSTLRTNLDNLIFEKFLENDFFNYIYGLYGVALTTIAAQDDYEIDESGVVKSALKRRLPVPTSLSSTGARTQFMAIYSQFCEMKSLQNLLIHEGMNTYVLDGICRVEALGQQEDLVSGQGSSEAVVLGRKGLMYEFLAKKYTPATLSEEDRVDFQTFFEASFSGYDSMLYSELNEAYVKAIHEQLEGGMPELSPGVLPFLFADVDELKGLDAFCSYLRSKLSTDLGPDCPIYYIEVDSSIEYTVFDFNTIFWLTKQIKNNLYK